MGLLGTHTQWHDEIGAISAPDSVAVRPSAYQLGAATAVVDAALKQPARKWHARGGQAGCALHQFSAVYLPKASALPAAAGDLRPLAPSGHACTRPSTKLPPCWKEPCHPRRLITPSSKLGSRRQVCSSPADRLSSLAGNRMASIVAYWIRALQAQSLQRAAAVTSPRSNMRL
ncbi:hypothetical protein SVAN01_01715 [Stagonosporopsis vannaccii]|nr:hypothetical protein SVAN01_01715 [Stagonosporopsis vannaccii]